MSEQQGFENESAAFLQWFQSQEGASFHPGLKLADLRSRAAGRGIIATQDIPAETDLFTIPKHAIICVETSELAQKLPELFSGPQGDAKNGQDETDGTEDADPWLNLILALLYESMHPETSKWAPYLRVVLPAKNDFDTLMYWSPDELAELQASGIVTKIGKDSAEAMFREKVLPVVKRHSPIFYSELPQQLSDEELIDVCHRIGSLIMSYAFDLQPDEDEEEDGDENEDGWVEDSTKPSTMGMVPMADMLNADAEFNAHLSHGEDALTMTSLRPIKAGEEVLNYYGPLPTGELLRRYGYVSSKHARYDVVEFGWTFVKAALSNGSSLFSGNRAGFEKAIAEVEADEGLDDSDGFIIEREAGDPNEEGMFSTVPKFAQFPEELVVVVSALVQEDLDTTSEKRKQTSGNRDSLVKLRTLQVLEELVSARVAQYATTLQEDESMVASQEIPERTKMALSVRMGEKRLLAEGHAWLKEKQHKYAQTQEQTDESQRTAKRLKR